MCVVSIRAFGLIYYLTCKKQTLKKLQMLEGFKICVTTYKILENNIACVRIGKITSYESGFGSDLGQCKGNPGLSLCLRHRPQVGLPSPQPWSEPTQTPNSVILP